VRKRKVHRFGGPGVVAPCCNPSLLGVRDLEDVVPGPVSTNKAGLYLSS
jgi:hypothetical protein